MSILKFSAFITTISLFLSQPLSILAANPIHNPSVDPLLGSNIGNSGSGANTVVATLLARFFSAMLAAGTMAFLAYLVYGAFKWLTAGGDKGAVASARGTITEAIIGLTILASVFAIANLIAPILGLARPGCSFPQQICWPTF